MPIGEADAATYAARFKHVACRRWRGWLGRRRWRLHLVGSHFGRAACEVERQQISDACEPTLRHSLEAIAGNRSRRCDGRAGGWQSKRQLDSPDWGACGQSRQLGGYDEDVPCPAVVGGSGGADFDGNQILIHCF